MLSANVAGTWKGITPYAKVAGSWKPICWYTRISDVWTLIHGVPAGLIIMSADGSTPTGWTRFSVADGKFIVGAGATYAAGSSGGSSTLSAQTANSTTDGTHNGHPSDKCDYGASYYIGSNDLLGAHSHVISYESYTPKKQRMVLIKASSALPEIPANGMLFNLNTPAGFSAFSSTSFLNGAASIGADAASAAVSCGSGGAHNHNNANTTADFFTNYVEGYMNTPMGGHTHTLTAPTVTDGFKQAVLRGVYKAAAYGLQPGLIGMWEGATPPVGWALCNGANGTVDLRDYFILFSVTGDGTRSGANSITFSVGMASDSWYHGYQTSAAQIKGNGTPSPDNYYGNVFETHSHNISVKVITYTPLYYALTFIQFTG